MKKASSPRSSVGQKKYMNVGIAILVGQLVVNLPVVLILLGAAAFDFYVLYLFGSWTALAYLPEWFGILLFFLVLVALIIIGFLIALLWMSFSVPRWRKWALQNGAPEEKLQEWAALTGLVWPPKSWINLRTILRRKD